VALVRFLEKSSLGRAIRGVSSNAELCGIVGVEVERTIHWAVAIGSALAALGGVLSALDTDMTPSMGFRLVLNGVIVFIIGGVGSYRGLVCGALLLGFAQHCVAYFLDSKWMDAIAFLILIGFLIWKPLGLSGRRLRKVEV
jgi:branched-chain amino acid transport system permease protein